MSDLSLLFKAEERVRHWKAEAENASARLDMALMERNMRYLISQHEPVASLNIDREKLRHILSYIEHGDVNRLIRDNKEK